MDLDLRLVRYFVAVAEELHFTRAAERLFISQPALSKQIRLLEESLRVDLFTRDRRAVALTPSGQALLTPARGLIADWDTAQQLVADAAAAAGAVLRIGFQTSIGRGLMPRITTEFTQRRPNWQLRLRQIDWDDPTGGLADRSTDLAIVWLPIPASDRFSVLVLAEEPRHVALPQSHPLAGQDVIDFADLRSEPFLALPAEAGPLRDYWLAVDERDGPPPRIGAVVANAEETFEAVAAGTGIVLLSAGNAAIYTRDGIVTRPVHGLTPSQLALVWRTDDHRDAVRDFQHAAATALSRHSGYAAAAPEDYSERPA